MGKGSELLQVAPSGEQQEVHEINSIECAECEELVDTRDPGGVLDLDQPTVPDTISLVPLRAGA
jgi:hypothetical protein